MGTNLLRIRNFSTFIKIVLMFWCVELREILYYKSLVVTNIQSVYILRNYSFETRPSQAGRSGTGTGPGWRKNSERKTRLTRWLGWPSKTQSKTQLQPVDFFFTKMTSFWLKKILTRVTRSKPGTWALDRAAVGPGLKTTVETNLSLFEFDQCYLA